MCSPNAPSDLEMSKLRPFRFGVIGDPTLNVYLLLVYQSGRHIT